METRMIYINDQGELLLIEAPEKPERLILHDHHFEFTPSYRKKWIAYDQALTSAIEKGIRFRDTQEQKILLLEAIPDCGVMGVNSELNLIGFNFNKGTYEIPNSYTADVVDGCQHKGIHNSTCIYRKVAVLTPLKQEPEHKTIEAHICPHSKLLCYDPQCGQTENHCNNSHCFREPGNEAKKDDGKHYATLGDADLTVKVLQWFIDNYSPVKMNAHDIYHIYLKTKVK